MELNGCSLEAIFKHYLVGRRGIFEVVVELAEGMLGEPFGLVLYPKQMSYSDEGLFECPEGLLQYLLAGQPGDERDLKQLLDGLVVVQVRVDPRTIFIQPTVHRLKKALFLTSFLLVLLLLSVLRCCMSMLMPILMMPKLKWWFLRGS